MGYRFVADVDVSAFRPYSMADNLDGSASARSESNDDVNLQPPAQPSIVVLPFQNLGDAQRSDVIAQGLTYDITTRIARSRVLFVIARGTASTFAGSAHDVRTIGERLGVRYVAQGAVQIRGRRMKVTASLANARTRQEVWSEQYDYKVDDWIRVQEELADLIVGSLQSEVECAEQRRSVLMPSVNLDAWSAYHRGCRFIYRFKAEDCANAEKFFRRSIELEPNVPRAYAGLAFVHFQRAFLHLTKDLAGEIQQTYELALASLAIDPADPMGHWALSRAHLLKTDLESAKHELETAIALNPSYAIAQYSLGWVALGLGENEVCADRVGYARRLSPYDPLKFAMMGVSALNLAMVGKTTEAAGLSARATLQPNAHHQVITAAAVCHVMDGQRARGRELFSRVRALSPGYNADEFLRTHPFRREQDIQRIRDAFNMLQSAKPALTVPANARRTAARSAPRPRPPR